MSEGDRRLLSWIEAQFNTGKRIIIVPAYLFNDTTEEGLAEARRLLALAGCKLELSI